MFADRNTAHNPLDAAVGHPMSKKWVPYQHKHQGVAVYLHINVSDGCDYLGGEFMVSSIINGTPEQCLAALTTNNSSTVGILGPAMQSKLLQTDGQSQVTHFVWNESKSRCICTGNHHSHQVIMWHELRSIQTVSTADCSVACDVSLFCTSFNESMFPSCADPPAHEPGP